MLGAGRAMHEVPRAQGPLLTLDEQHALAGEHEEILLIRLAVVHRRRLTGLHDAEPEAEIRELGRFELGVVTEDPRITLEDAPRAEGIARQPGRIGDVHDEPAVGNRSQAGRDLLETRLVGHG